MSFHLNHHRLIYEIHMALKLLGRNLKSCYSPSCASHEGFSAFSRMYFSFYLVSCHWFHPLALLCVFEFLFKFQTKISGNTRTGVHTPDRAREAAQDLSRANRPGSQMWDTFFFLLHSPTSCSLCYRFRQLFSSLCP